MTPQDLNHQLTKQLAVIAEMLAEAKEIAEKARVAAYRPRVAPPEQLTFEGAARVYREMLNHNFDERDRIALARIASGKDIVISKEEYQRLTAPPAARAEG